MLGPQFLQGVRSVARRSGQIAPVLAEAWPEIAGEGPHVPAAPRPGALAATAGDRLLVLRAAPVAWERHPTLAGDPGLIAVLREAATPPALLLALPPDADPGDAPTPLETLRRALAHGLAHLWRDPEADDAQRREIVSAARAANRLGVRLRAAAGAGAAISVPDAGP
ncbi:MAG TPA: hypothetical protein VK837_00475 [Longimicrobiales bacterium]|nr:hypothetical protein [Longimicrobiales bacterium]